MNTTTASRQPLTVGASTENLLLALQAVEDARTRYFAAFEAVGGERYAGDMTDRAAAPFDALRDLIAGEIRENVMAWAGSGNPAKVL
jgi:hypothetical protein